MKSTGENERYYARYILRSQIISVLWFALLANTFHLERKDLGRDSFGDIKVHTSM